MAKVQTQECLNLHPMRALFIFYDENKGWKNPTYQDKDAINYNNTIADVCQLCDNNMSNTTCMPCGHNVGCEKCVNLWNKLTGQCWCGEKTDTITIISPEITDVITSDNA